MAVSIDVEALRDILRNKAVIRQKPFETLKSISQLASDPERDQVAREMVLRALENSDAFGNYSPMLDALVRAVGLYPYAEPEALSLRDRIAYEFHRPESMPEDFVFHREQAQIYFRLLAGESVILSAPTSFGKSRIIDALIATGKYKNIAVVVPTLALIDETRRRLAYFSNAYKIITHLLQPAAEKNIFIFTPERIVAYDPLPKFDFFVIDEFYKLGAMDGDLSRTAALNQAFYRLHKQKGQFYLLGPNIKEIPAKFEEDITCYFHRTSFNTVVAEEKPVSQKGEDIDRLVELARSLDEPTLVFCSSPARVNMVARALVDAGIGKFVPNLKPASEWAAANYHPEWVFCEAIKRGIGIHHGKLPRSLAQYIVRKFNESDLQFLVCTSTLIEGVNTKAKNVIIFDNKIAKKAIDYFTFNNIKGRSGRMFHHFIGRVYLFHDPPHEQLPLVDFPWYTQGEKTPSSLLVQMDESDLHPSAYERVQEIMKQGVLPFEIIRGNPSIAPEDQIELARAIQAMSRPQTSYLSWTRFPSYDQLNFACMLIWKYFVKAQRSSGGVHSGKQLALKVSQLQNLGLPKQRVRAELNSGEYAAKTPDEAVERVLDFERNWASFEFPKCLIALSSIQKHVLEQRGLRAGDYKAYASQVESLFRKPVVAALDEYGIPPLVGEKLLPYIDGDDLDKALEQLRQLNTNELHLSPFERDVVEDAKSVFTEQKLF